MQPSTGQCMLVLNKEQILKGIKAERGDYLIFTCDYTNGFHRSPRSKGVKLLVSEIGQIKKPQISMRQSIFKTENDVLVQCLGTHFDRIEQCKFYNNWKSEPFITQPYDDKQKLCIIKVNLRRLESRQSSENICVTWLSCDIDVIVNEKKITSPRSEMEKVEIESTGYLGMPQLNVTPAVFQSDETTEMTCNMPSFHDQAQCNYYKNNESKPFRTVAAKANRCLLSVSGKELLEDKVDTAKSELEICCDYMESKSSTTVSLFSNSVTVVVLMLPKPKISFQSKTKLFIHCDAPPSLRGTVFYLYQNGTEKPTATVSALETDHSVIFEIPRNGSRASLVYSCVYEYQGYRSAISDHKVFNEYEDYQEEFISSVTLEFLIRVIIVGIYFFLMGLLLACSHHKSSKNRWRQQREWQQLQRLPQSKPTKKSSLRAGDKELDPVALKESELDL
ncbi:uncharacterized protein LOC114643166 [Erpetoichthys calabaricus]|uniref:uncharacterized protein LOC114643166 n=1 Tax=Erpetoichthys calabaricus TaxID=27687 RepID=UPI0022348B23|nr:uncharacterized protein LOC114643166 [Erpetoichthys calabaricus]